MPYPNIFRPNTTCHAYDIFGGDMAGCRLQLFRPLLGCTFNSSNAPEQFQIPSGGALLRGILERDLTTLDLSAVGPPVWGGGVAPYFFLDEDPFGANWQITDGLVWEVSNPTYLLSFFASKKQDAPNQGGAADPVPPRIPFEVWEHDTPPPGASLGTLNIGFFVPPTRTDLTGITGAVSIEKLNKSVVVGVVDAAEFFTLLTPAQSTPMFWVRWTDPNANDWYYVVQWWEWRAGSDASGTDITLLMLQTNDTGDFPRGN